MEELLRTRLDELEKQRGLLQLEIMRINRLQQEGLDPEEILARSSRPSLLSAETAGLRSSVREPGKAAS